MYINFGTFAVYFVGCNPMHDTLAEKAATQLEQFYRPKTTDSNFPFILVPPSSPLCSFGLHRIFTVKWSLPFLHLCLYLFFASKFKSLDPPSAILHHYSVFLSLRSLALPQIRRVKGIFDIESLHSIT